MEGLSTARGPVGPVPPSAEGILEVRPPRPSLAPARLAAACQNLRPRANLSLDGADQPSNGEIPIFAGKLIRDDRWVFNLVPGSAASHADPRTMMRYDRARDSLDRHAT